MVKIISYQTGSFFAFSPNFVATKIHVERNKTMGIVENFSEDFPPPVKTHETHQNFDKAQA